MLFQTQHDKNMASGIFFNLYRRSKSKSSYYISMIANFKNFDDFYPTRIDDTIYRLWVKCFDCEKLLSHDDTGSRGYLYYMLTVNDWCTTKEFFSYHSNSVRTLYSIFPGYQSLHTINGEIDPLYELSSRFSTTFSTKEAYLDFFSSLYENIGDAGDTAAIHWGKRDDGTDCISAFNGFMLHDLLGTNTGLRVSETVWLFVSVLVSKLSKFNYAHLLQYCDRNSALDAMSLIDKQFPISRLSTVMRKMAGNLYSVSNIAFENSGDDFEQYLRNALYAVSIIGNDILLNGTDSYKSGSGVAIQLSETEDEFLDVLESYAPMYPHDFLVKLMTYYYRYYPELDIDTIFSIEGL